MMIDSILRVIELQKKLGVIGLKKNLMVIVFSQESPNAKEGREKVKKEKSAPAASKLGIDPH